jgi:hypothetical protein
MKKFMTGKLPKKHDDRNLKFAKYIKALAPAPDAVDNLSNIYVKLNISDPTILFPLDGNDVLGDCTICGVAHAITLYNGLIGVNKIPSQDDVVALYNQLTS